MNRINEQFFYGAPLQGVLAADTASMDVSELWRLRDKVSQLQRKASELGFAGPCDQLQGFHIALEETIVRKTLLN